MVGIVDSEGNHASFPIFALIAVYDGFDYKKDTSGKIRGLKISTGGENHVIYPDSKQERLDFAFKTIKFGGRELPKDCQISIIRQEEPKDEKPIPVSIPAREYAIV